MATEKDSKKTTPKAAPKATASKKAEPKKKVEPKATAPKVEPVKKVKPKVEESIKLNAKNQVIVDEYVALKGEDPPGDWTIDHIKEGIEKIKEEKRLADEIKKIPVKTERVTPELLRDVMKIAAVKMKSDRPEIRKEGEQEVADINKRLKEQRFMPNPNWKK